MSPQPISLFKKKKSRGEKEVTTMARNSIPTLKKDLQFAENYDDHQF